MQGRVYSVRIQGHADNEPHPHVVVLEFEGECLMVPAFSAGGSDVEKRLALLEEMGLPRDVTSVELDNAKHITWVRGRTGKRACWCAWRNAPIPNTLLGPANYVGMMDQVGVRAIVECLLRYATARPEQFSRNRVKRLKSALAAMAEPAP
jgi:hypothetical protein